jgi:23S rRNA G2445 N2-methylase RlmL
MAETSVNEALASSGGRNQLRLVGVAGANRVMAGELSRLVRRAHDDVRVPEPKKEGPGAISYPFDPKMASTAVQFHRTSARVLWELYRFPISRLEELYKRLCLALEADPRQWFWSGATLSVRAFSVQGFPAGERQVVGTVKNAIIETAARAGIELSVEPETPDLNVDVRVVDEALSIALDLAGQPMHQRGYREVAGPAPLREDLAAMLVMLARYDSRSEVLLDPMAGSGTIGIEAALMGLGKPIWCQGRVPSCSGWRETAISLAPVDSVLFPGTQPLVILNEGEAQLVQSANHNAKLAGVSEGIEFLTGDFSQVTPELVAKVAAKRGADPRGGVILCNPPYGERLGNKESVRPLYRELGRWCRTFRGWRAGFLVSHENFEFDFGARARLKKPLKNGPLDAMFYLFDL